MSTRNLDQRVTRGLLIRFDAFCPLGQTNQLSCAEAARSIAGRVNASKTLDSSRTQKQLDAEVEIINFGLRLKSQADRIRLFEQLKGTHAPNFDALKFLTLGEQFCGDNPDRAKTIRDLCDLDLSLVLSSHLAKILARTGKLKRITASKLESFFLKAGIERPQTCRQLSAYLKAFGLVIDIQSSGQIGDAFYGLKQIAWPLFGSDILIFMQGLADANSILQQDQLGTLLQISSLWGLDVIARRLILLRSINGLVNERHFVGSDSSVLPLSQL
jgi:hypothetical protein